MRMSGTASRAKNCWRSNSLSVQWYLGGVMLVCGLALFSPLHADNLKQVYSKSNVDSEVTLKVLKQVSARMHASFVQSCGGDAPHRGSWTVACNGTYPYGGNVTYACISGIAAIQSQDCK